MGKPVLVHVDLVGRLVALTVAEPVASVVRDRLAELVVLPDAAARRRIGVRACLAPAPTASGIWELSGDQGLVAAVDGAGAAFDLVVSWLNVVAASSPDHLCFHAAAAVRDGRALLLPAAAGEGKSTLTAALVQRGWSYLSDEVAAVDDELVVAPHPKPLTLKAGGPGGPAGHDPRQRLYHRVGELGGLVAPPTVAAAVVFPSYRRGRAGLEPLGPTATALRLARTVHIASPFRLDRIAQLASTRPAWRLVHDDLDEAERLLRLAAASPKRSSPPATVWPLATTEGSALASRDVNHDSQLRPAAGVGGAAFSDGALLWHAPTDHLVALDTVGATLWPLLEGSHSLAGLATELAPLFAAAPDDVLGDLVALCRQLAGAGMLSAPLNAG